MNISGPEAAPYEGLFPGLRWHVLPLNCAHEIADLRSMALRPAKPFF